MNTLITTLSGDAGSRCRSRPLQGLCIALLISISTSANALSYTYLDLGTLGGSVSGATGINNSGQIVGYSSLAGDVGVRAVVWNGSIPTELGALAGPYSAAFAINDVGRIAGRTTLSTGNGGATFRATSWLNGSPIALGTLGGTSSTANAINSTGQIVGYSDVAGDLGFHATVWNGKFMTDLGTLGGSYSGANDINDAGQVVGYSYAPGNGDPYAMLWDGISATALGGASSGANGINNNGQIVGFSRVASGALHATLWNGLTPTDLGTLGGASSNALGINGSGQVVGYSDTADGLGRQSTLWNEGVAIDLNRFLDAKALSEGWGLFAFGSGRIAINDSGVIVGTAYNNLTGEQRAYVLTPSAVPLPAALPLMAAGLGLLGVAARRRRMHVRD